MISEHGFLGSKVLSINIYVGLAEQAMALSLHCTRRGEACTVTICDLSHVDGKQYAIAVDIFDTNNDVILDALLATMNRNDVVTLITFGDHIESEIFSICDKVPEIVWKMMNRRETGCNVAGALHELDQTDCDHRVLISNGAYDDGPEEVTLTNEVILISRGIPSYPIITYPITNNGAQLVLNTENKICMRKQIRQLLGKSRPNYYGIIFTAGARHYVQPVAFGGCTTLHVGDFEGNINLTYYNSKGKKFNEVIQID